MTPRVHQPLSESELLRLNDFLRSIQGGSAMSVEELDGFFNALIAGPELVMPSEYWPQVVGGNPEELCVFESEHQAQEIMGLLMRHWNVIASTLASGEPYIPVLLEDEHGTARGNAWAIGFLRGVHMRVTQWASFLDDEEQSMPLYPVLALAGENHPDPQLRFEALSPPERETLLAELVLGVMQINNHFHQLHAAASSIASIASCGRKALAPGHGERCDCGSGRSLRQCCGRRVH